jgi:hypothetical protein
MSQRLISHSFCHPMLTTLKSVPVRTDTPEL